MIALEIKKEIGEKVRTLREQSGLSREQFCESEAELTVRQLARIELGESLPTIPKLSYISKRLGISMQALIGEKDLELPKEYIQIKYILYKHAAYDIKERREKKEAYFDLIYEKYYEELPKEEQLAIDVLRASADILVTGNPDFGDKLLSDYFPQVEQKQVYSINDLLIFKLYFLCSYYKNYDKKKLNSFIKNLILYSNYSTDTELSILNIVLISAMTVAVKEHEYDLLRQLLDMSSEVMEKNQDFSRKPVVDMVEGKYLLFAQMDIKGAKQRYKEAAKLATLIGDSRLSDKILQEYELDLKILQAKKFQKPS